MKDEATTTQDIIHAIFSRPALYKIAKVLNDGGRITDIRIHIKARQFDGSEREATIDQHGTVRWNDKHSPHHPIAKKWEV